MKDLLYKMSEDAKEKGTGKQALRKKKGKKVTRKLLKHTDLFSLKLRACLNPAFMAFGRVNGGC